MDGRRKLKRSDVRKRERKRTGARVEKSIHGMPSFSERGRDDCDDLKELKKSLRPMEHLPPEHFLDNEYSVLLIIIQKNSENIYRVFF